VHMPNTFRRTGKAARCDKLAVGFEPCLNQSVVPADKKVSLFDDIANLHRDLKDSSTSLCGKEDGVELLHRAATSDDFFKRLSAHRNGFHGGRRMHEASLSSVGADHVKNSHEHEQTKKATDDQEDQPVGTEIRSASRWAARMPSGPAFHRFGCELETARSRLREYIGELREFHRIGCELEPARDAVSRLREMVRRSSYRTRNARRATVIAPKVNSS
jgi:hypothetical protein